MKKLLKPVGAEVLTRRQLKKISGGAMLNCIPEGGLGCIYIGGQPGQDGCCPDLVCKQFAATPPNSGTFTVCLKP